MPLTVLHVRVWRDQAVCHGLPMPIALNFHRLCLRKKLLTKVQRNELWLSLLAKVLARHGYFEQYRNVDELLYRSLRFFTGLRAFCYRYFQMLQCYDSILLLCCRVICSGWVYCSFPILSDIAKTSRCRDDATTYYNAHAYSARSNFLPHLT